MTVRQSRERASVATRRMARMHVRRPVPDAAPVAVADPELEPEVEVEPEVEESTVDEPTTAKPGRRLRLFVAILLVLLVAAGASAAVFGQRWYVRTQVQAAHQQALAAARQETLDFVSISASSVDRDLARIAAGATGEFKDQFTRGMAQVRQAVVENNVSSHGNVLRAGLVSGDRDSAVVLVAVDANVKNVRAPDGRLSHYRIQVDLVKDHAGRWLVSRLQFIG